MSRLFRIALVFALALLGPRLASAQTPSLQDLGGVVGSKSSTTIYLARSFLTMDPKRPRAEAIAVRDGRFVAVGKLADVEKAVGKDAKLDRTFADKVVIAGFVEQHVHPVLAALTMQTAVISIEDWDALDGFSPAVRDEKGYEKRLKEALTAHGGKKTPFITWGYHHYFHGTKLSRKRLTELAADVPVIVWHRSCHEFILNDAALKLTGIDARFVGALPRSAQTQSSLEKGHFFEQGALAILNKLAPFLASPARFRTGLEYTVKYYHRAGITVACEPGGFFSKPLQDAINAVYSDDSTPFNHFFIADGKSFAARNPKDARAMVADSEQVLTWGKGRTAYLPRQVKLLTDGAIYSQLMMMKDGYTDKHEGAWIMDPPVFAHAFQGYWDAGYQIHVHNNGDAGMDVLLDNLEKAMKRKLRDDHRTVIVHFGFATPKQVERAAKLGAIVSANPYYVTALAGRYSKLGIGPERSRNMVPLGEVTKNKMPLSFHSDMPMAPARPMQLVWSAVNRLTAEGEVVGASHRVSLDVALRAMTIEAAYSIRQEKEIGSIEVGKRANLTVLEKDPYEAEAKALKDLTVWGTMLEGRVQPFDPKAKSKSHSRPSADREAVRLGWNTREAALPPEGAGGRAMAALFGGDAAFRSRDPRVAACGSGCTCSIGHLLGASILAQMNAEKRLREQ